jgi:hypothetical protein
LYMSFDCALHQATDLANSLSSKMNFFLRPNRP